MKNLSQTPQAVASRKWYAANRDRQRKYRERPEVKKKYAAYYSARYKRLGQQIRAERAVYGKAYRAAKPWQKLLLSAKRRAAKSGLSFALTPHWAIVNYTGFCSLTGIPFDINGAAVPGPRAFSPSIDRIEPSLGYIPGNCRFILMAVNAFRGTLSDSQMLEVAKALVSVGPVVESRVAA